MHKLGICFPLFNIYGIGALILLGLRVYLPNVNNLVLAIIATIVITLMECLVGQLSFKINGKQTWNYSSGVCNGFISLRISMFWFICSFLFYMLF